MMKKLIWGVLCILFPFFSLAQKKIAVLGSSTAAGYGASVYDSAWVGRLQAEFRKNTTAGDLDTVINNMAWSGYTTYHVMPSDFIPPADRPSPTAYNVTAALAWHPDIILINLPTNDIGNGYNMQEYMNNLRMLFNLINGQGVKCYISTTQPRSLEADRRQMLRQLVDSININFQSYAINFWDDIVSNDGQYYINSQVNVDGIHINDLGHRYLFLRTKAKNIFSSNAPLPLSLLDFSAHLQNNQAIIKWETANEEANSLFEIQRSDNGIQFQTIYQRSGTGRSSSYSWSDASPLSGKSFYRLKINELSKTSYSKIIPVINDTKELITSFYSDGSQLHLQLQTKNNQAATITVVNCSGSVLKKQSFNLTPPNAALTVPILELPSGNYFLRIRTSEGQSANERFSIMK